MTAIDKLLTGAPSANLEKWNSINWNHITNSVKRLQVRIAKATRDGRHGKAKSLQWLLIHSLHGKLLATRRVTSNKGSKTPGVDGVLWLSGRQKMKGALSLKRKGYKPQPLRRIYIPKSNGKKRPLGIPAMKCRALQALHLLALEPIAECLSDRNSYGFRQGRSCADAIEQCFNILSRKHSARFVLEGDIESCFDKISHDWLLKNTPTDRGILRKWLRSGFMEKGSFFTTREGTPQGGIISPTLLNLTLSGLEEAILSSSKKSMPVQVVIYADDFIVTCKSEKILQETVKPIIMKFLEERGLRLSESKTRITSIDKGFDFLGHNVRKYKDKLLIKPSKSNITNFLRNIRNTIKSYPTCKTENLIHLLNPKIRGWSNYFRHAVAKDAFSYVDSEIFWSIWRWALRRHLHKSKDWIWRKYFPDPSISGNLKSTVTSEGQPKTISLVRASTTLIRRHVKIKADANPFDPAYFSYFEIRKRKKKDKIEEAFEF